MSAMLSMLKSKALPKLQLVDEFEAMTERSETQQADYDALLVELDGIKADIEGEQQRETKARGHSDFWQGLVIPARPRASAYSPRPDDAHVEAAIKTWSQQVFDSPQFENIKRGGTTMDPVAVTGLKAVYAPRPATGGLIGVISGPGTPAIPFRLLELMPMLEYNGASVPYLPMAATNPIVPTAWGTAKPEVINSGAVTNAPMVTLPGIKYVARQSLRYIPGLADSIDRELLYFVQVAITNYVVTQLLAAVTASASNTDMVTAILGAVALVEGQGIPVNGILIHPQDLAGIRALAWTAKYLPAVNDGNILGYPTVPTSATPVGTALVGNFAMGAHLYVGEEANVRVNDAPNTNNTVLFVGEADVAVTPDVPAWFAKAIDLP